MGKKEEFKEFSKLHPELIKYIENNTMTWQKFYEIYDLYGENNDIWNKYINNNQSDTRNNNTSTNNSTSWSDIVNMAKNIDVDKVQNGITSLQKALGLVSDLFIKDNNPGPNSNYTPRPLYRSFED